MGTSTRDIFKEPAGLAAQHAGLRQAGVEDPLPFRAFSSSLTNRAEVPTQFLKIKEKQKAFGINNGLRVHERGVTDKAVMAFTQGMLVVGAVFWVQTVFTMAK